MAYRSAPERPIRCPRFARPIIIGIILGIAESNHQVSAQAVPPCVTDDRQRAGLKDWVERFVAATASDTQAALAREEMHLPQVASVDSVKPVTDPIICARLRVALAATVENDHPAPDSLSVAVVQVDTVYVAYAPRLTAGEWKLGSVFGTAFQDLGRFFY